MLIKMNNNSEELRYRLARESMVKLMQEKGILRNPNVISVFSKIPRHLFVEQALWDRAYFDTPLPIGANQTISHPSTVARMTELLDVQPSHRILEIGTGSGYQTAILAELSQMVYSIENHQELHIKARQLIANLGYYNVELRYGDGSPGYDDAAPFDRILVTAGSPSIPRVLCFQLTESGRMVIPVGDRNCQRLTLIQRHNDELIIEEYDSCIFVDLIGRHGFHPQ
jgi:protein-L-isoaspartate(D-aspartate) O-methyltransferase